MSTAELDILLQLKDQATEGLKQFNNTIQDAQTQLKTVAVAAVAAGAAITGSLTMCVMAGQKEVESEARLAQTIKNTGISYDSVGGQIDNLIKSEMALTSFSNINMYEALNQLVLVTGSYNGAMKLLPVALDLAAAKQIDVSTAAIYLGRIMDGNTAGLTRMMPWLIGVKDAQEAMRITMEKVAGAAEATVNPFDQLKNELEMLAGTIGKSLLPMLKGIVDTLVPIIQGITQWMEAHPKLTEGITITVGAIGLLLLVGGSLILLLLGLNALFMALPAVIGVASTALEVLNGVLLTLAANPVFWIIAGVIGAAAVGFGIYKLVTGMQSSGTSSEVPSFASGGVVPGPIGAPVPIIAHGGERYLGASGSGGGDTYNITIQGSVQTEKSLAEAFRKSALYIKNRNGATLGLA